MNPRHRRALIPGLLVVLLVIVLVAALAREARAADGEVDVERVSTITDARVPESSALVVSKRDPELAYTINDSGNVPTVFTIEVSTGDVVGATRLAGAEVVDTEALAIDHDGTLWVADIGDNDAIRSTVSLLAIEEPVLGEKSVRPLRYEVRYADGSADAEALLADPSGHGMFIVSKGLLGGQVYRLPQPLSRTSVNVAQPMAEAEAPALVTDGDFLPDGAQVVLRTYLGVHVLDATTWQETWSATLPETRQSESLAAEPDGTSVLVGSEGLPSPIQRVTLPEEQRAAMLAPASGIIDLD
ncbi:esterase-like activity of phytase family protein [Mumia zhuanghuii]|uniref:Esterase-like activity of phytase family protein n=2 Tax=Mumia TaxID=1546255 RepID=A0ABW1QEW1_9ACTN|nr:MULTISPECIES: esterase-like activity of phytase family protein [Mumia]KAA1422870.1 esterase-like activity of phytase family protein [Mumia zhuanghuii]